MCAQWLCFHHALFSLSFSRRHQLLARLGVTFTILDSNVPEIRADNETALAYVERVASDKAQAGLAQLKADTSAYVLAADTEVVLDERVFGKPADLQQAAAMLALLSGRAHYVITSVVLAAQQRQALVTVTTEVTFTTLTAQDIADYVATGEPLDKAGGYAIQGYGECFVSRLAGSYSGVMGLPLQQTAALLDEFGLHSKSTR